MGGTLIVRGLHTFFNDPYVECLMGMSGKGMPDEGGMEEFQIVKVWSA